MVLQATAFSIDRGACIKDLSQYPGEVPAALASTWLTASEHPGPLRSSVRQAMSAPPRCRLSPFRERERPVSARGGGVGEGAPPIAVVTGEGLLEVKSTARLCATVEALACC
jgi:hypothetical protein